MEGNEGDEVFIHYLLFFGFKNVVLVEIKFF